MNSNKKVGAFLRLFRGTLYKKYPSLWKRQLSVEERRRLIQIGCADQSLASNIILLKEPEVDEILQGHEEKYKALTISNEPAFSTTKIEKPKKGTNWTQSLRPEQHLDAVPAPTPINRNRINPKKRTFPLW
jgi:SWI/SNF-related matrix-associated actin-dependent regulator of chromatin subfamily B protein 1